MFYARALESFSAAHSHPSIASYRRARQAIEQAREFSFHPGVYTSRDSKAHHLFTGDGMKRLAWLVSVAALGALLAGCGSALAVTHHSHPLIFPTLTPGAARAAPGTKLLTYHVPGQGSPSIVWSPDSQRIATADTSHNKILIWDASTGQTLLTLQAADVGGNIRLAWSPDGKQIAETISYLGSNYPNSVDIWDATTGALVMTLQDAPGQINALAYSPDSQRLAYASDNATVTIWDVSTGQKLYTYQAPGPVKGQVINDFFQQEFFVTLSTLIAILPGLALLLLYVILASAALTERNRDEIALMKSRGASAWQILSLSLLDALLLGGVALLVAPPLASGITGLITRLSFFGATVAASGFTVSVPDLQTYLYALVAVLCCLAALLTPAVLAARASIIAPKQQSARSGKAWLWLRLAPGSLLAALGGFGYVEIAQRGAFFTRSAKGALSVDWVASSAPTLLLLGVAGLSLLLLPLLLIVLDRLVQRLPGIAASLALRQMARRPAPYSRLALLLTLTVMLGIFASLFSGTLLGSIEDRAAYQSGSDLRLMEGALNTADVNRQAAPLADHLAFLPGATGGMNLFRDTQAKFSNILQAANVTTLAIDSSTFGHLAYWRSDFANQPLGNLLTTLRQSVQQPDSLPALVDDRFLADSGAHLGDSINIQLGNAAGTASNQSVPVAINFIIAGTFHYFPTLDTTQYAVVCDLSKLLQLVNEAGLVSLTPNEIWLKLASNAPQYTVDSVIQQLTFNRSHRQVVVALNQVYDRATLEQSYRNDPLHFSISGALSLDFVVAALLSVIGFVLLFYLLARRRAFEFGVLRAMGLSLRQLAGSLSWEQGILVCAAAILGGALGILLAQAVLPALATDNSGKPLLPPYAPQLDVGSVIQLGLFLIACALAALVATLVIFRRLRLQEVLRLGEE
jgi:putative ABC transport system permease protein